jgi:GNAT superfamily N-acetyltransferase
MNVLEAAGDGGYEFTEQKIRDMISTEVARDTSMVLAADGTLAAAGMVSAPPPGRSRARTVGGVHPNWRGRGIGRALLRWQFERIAEVRAERGSTDQWTVTAGAGIVDESAVGLFRRARLQPVRYFLQMHAATAGPRPAPQPAGVRVAEYITDLRAAIYAAHMEAFAGHWGLRRPRDQQVGRANCRIGSVPG